MHVCVRACVCLHVYKLRGGPVGETCNGLLHGTKAEMLQGGCYGPQWSGVVCVCTHANEGVSRGCAHQHARLERSQGHLDLTMLFFLVSPVGAAGLWEGVLVALGSWSGGGV